MTSKKKKAPKEPVTFLRFDVFCTRLRGAHGSATLSNPAHYSTIQEQAASDRRWNALTFEEQALVSLFVQHYFHGNPPGELKVGHKYTVIDLRDGEVVEGDLLHLDCPCGWHRALQLPTHVTFEQLMELLSEWFSGSQTVQ